jgi:ribosome maturation factor RimP
MITVERLRSIVGRHLEGTPHFLVDLAILPGDKVVVEVDNDRAITLDELARLNRALRDDLGPAADGYELQVASPGMGRPFKVARQYQKHLGRRVEVMLTDGRTLQGRLTAYDSVTLGLRIEHPSKVKGRPPKLDEEVTTLPLDQVKSTKAIVTFNRPLP